MDAFEQCSTKFLYLNLIVGYLIDGLAGNKKKEEIVSSSIIRVTKIITVTFYRCLLVSYNLYI